MFRESATQAYLPEEKIYVLSRSYKLVARSGKCGIFKFQTNVNSLGIPETILSGRKTRTARSTLSDSDSLMRLLSIPEIIPTNLE